jgi:hypothetical protein
MDVIIFSSCKRFRAVRKAGHGDFKVTDRENKDECVGFIHNRNAKARWVFDPLFYQFTSTELMDLAMLVSTCRLTVQKQM